MTCRRAFLQTLGLVTALLTCSGAAFAGSYLSRAAVLLKGAELEAKALRERFFDKELARALHALALARAEATRAMQVPPEVLRAHPHLLLVMESYERAAYAATQGQQSDFLVALARARDEARIFEAVLKQAGWTLPT